MATREDIVASCLHLFARRGFEGTSIDEIARAVGVTKGSLYWHFSGKESLFEAVLDRIRATWLTIVARPLGRGSAVSRLTQLFEHYKHLLLQEPDICLFLQRLLLDATPVYSRRASQVYDRTAEFTARVIRQGIDAGIFRADQDARLVGREILGALAGAHVQCLSDPTLSLELFVDQIREGTLRRLCTLEPAAR